MTLLDEETIEDEVGDDEIVQCPDGFDGLEELEF